MTERYEAELILDAKADLAEGPFWHPREAALYWVNIEAGEVHRFDPASGEDEVFDVGQPVGAAAPRARGGLILALRDGFGFLDGDSGALEMAVAVEADQPLTRMNDGKCDPSGRFWAGTMSSDLTPGASLYCLKADLSVTKVLSDITISNGLGWPSDGRRMVYIDSMAHGIDAFDYHPEEPSLSNRRRLIDIPESRGLPDGMTLDADDHLWVAVWGSGTALRYTPAGQLTAVVELPARNVTSCAFGGPDLSDLYITTARLNLSDEQLRKEPHAGGLFRCRPRVKGLPAREFSG